MKIHRIQLKNFKGFQDAVYQLHPEFTLIVGENGSGKTGILDGLAVAAGSFFLGVTGYKTRHILSSEVRYERFGFEGGTRWERQFPCEVCAEGTIGDSRMSWCRTLNTVGGRTTYGGANELKSRANVLANRVRSGEEVVLPLIAYYGSGRLWDTPRKRSLTGKATYVATPRRMSRMAGYDSAVDPRIRMHEVTELLARLSWSAFQRRDAGFAPLRLMKSVMVKNLPGARAIEYDADIEEIVVDIEGQGAQPFSNLSDGQRSVLALVADMTYRAIVLNPQLNSDQSELAKMPGFVLIDELDLHLHPRWQRNVVENLRRTFSNVQFVCTTHSPFVIQSVRNGDELLVLGGEATYQVGNRSINQIAEGLQGVEDASRSAQYAKDHAAATEFAKELFVATSSPKGVDEKTLSSLSDKVKQLSHNPAMQALLEFELAAKAGSRPACVPFAVGRSLKA